MLKIGICGYGTVGQSFIEHLRVHSDKIKSNISEEYEISLIADRSIDKKEHDKDIAVTKDAMEMALNPAIDIIIELMGGIDIPYKLITSAIKNKKHVVTANKALIAEHGDEIFQLAEKYNVYFGFEASVAGAIPIIQTLTNNMSNENITSVTGIINGTCNYILDQMSSNSLEFSDALNEAKKLGYAEADPTFDINGMDAAHKISILASLIYKVKSPLKNTYIEGIENITTMDIEFSRELGYSIKHVGITSKVNNLIQCRVHPVLVHKDNILSQVLGVMNALLVTGDKFGTSMLYGNGAGGDATASAVVANLVEAINFSCNRDMRNKSIFKNSGSHSYDVMKNDDIMSPFYLRIYALDISGVMAEITNILAKEDISIEAVTQHEPTDSDSPIPIVMITNNVSGSSINKSINKIELLAHVEGKVHAIRVLKTDDK
ncbi:MAG: homoserine dehydrogenase [Gammaproteobacteria bacterium]|nr:homoserine dehydrogenase [Gammaproteobacteria bacterium]MBT5863034.1 homoserine dehydrogenase [Gammaproteobacteria bacterium]MBT7236095.1 homoserine dehydrogenase [Gammaproteobacteria bacterium]